MKEENSNSTDLVMEQIKEKFGEGVIMKLGEVKRVDVESIPTGSVSLDIALGIGGIPRGRVIEIYGPESSGKTTLALHIIANVQKAKGTAAFIDAEHALDPEYAKKIGVKINDLLISQPDNGEQALDIVETLVSSGAINLIVVDSVAALVPKAEIEGEMGDPAYGTASALDVAGSPEAHGDCRQIKLHRDFHQPDPDENRNDVRQSGNDHRRKRFEILFFGQD